MKAKVSAALFLVAGLFASASHALTNQPFFKQSFLNLQEDLAEAREAGKTLMLVYEQDGCPYCARMHKEIFTDAEVLGLLETHFDVVQLDIWGDREIVGLDGKSRTEKDYARHLKIHYSPLIVFVDGAGKEIFRMGGFYPPPQFKAALRYLGSGAYKSTRFVDYAPAQRNAKGEQGAPAASALFNPSASLRSVAEQAKGTNKGVAVLFDAPGCADCREMHEISLKDAATAGMLTEHFAVIRADARGDRPMEDFRGKTLKERELAQALGVRYLPTVIFFDNKGKELLRHDSYLQPAHFRLLLAYVTTDARSRFRSFQDWIRARNTGQIEK